MRIMSGKQYLSTGEAAQVLNISRSTVSRRFDAGQLDGKLNPITGERLISRQSVEETIRKHNLPVELSFSGTKQIIIGSADGDLSSLVEGLLEGDTRTQTTTCMQGTDILIACARNKPDLLVVDDQLPDIRGSHVIKSLRKHVDMGDIKVIFCATGGAGKVDAAKAWGADDCFDKSGPHDRTALRETLYRLMGLTEEVSPARSAHEHKRRWPRFPVDVEASLTAIPIGNPTRRFAGRARVKDISAGGACLTDISMENASFPGEPFKMLLAVDQDPLKQFNARCQVVRLQASDTLSAGVQFEEISDENRTKITRLER